MKDILFISHTSEMHGSGKSLLNLASHIIEEGFKVTVVVPKDKGSLIELFLKHNIPYKVMDVEISVYPKFITRKDHIRYPYRLLKQIAKRIRFFFELNTYVKNNRPDIIHTNVGVIHTGYSVAKRNKIPHVWHLREYQDLDFGYKPFPSKRHFLKKLSNPNNNIIANTKGVYNHFYLDKMNAQIIYNGFVINNIPSIKPQKKNYLLFVGAVTERKGVEEVIAAFTKISTDIPTTELWIAGAGTKDYIKHLKSKILTENIKFLGHRTDAYNLMQEAKAMIVPSISEGFGLITAEAMLNGCLVIGKNAAGTKEQFDNGVTLFNQEIGIRYNTISELKEYMINVSKNDSLEYCAQLKTAQQTVLELYNVENYVSSIKNVYLRLLNSIKVQ